MDSSDSSDITNKKTKQIASLYGLIDPFFEPTEALEKVKQLKETSKKETNDKDLQFLYIIASMLNINASMQSIRNAYIHVNVEKPSLKKAIALHVLAEKGTLSIKDATRKIDNLNEELKAQGVIKPLRKLTLFATLIDKETEPYFISKKLMSIQNSFYSIREKN